MSDKKQIKHRWSGKVLYESETANSIKELVEEAVKNGVYLGGAFLGAADLRGASLGGASLGSAFLGGAFLGGANLRAADLRGADLGGASLGGASLGGAFLGGSHLHGADLRAADLRGADLRAADLRGASLGGANLRAANLGGANLGGASLGSFSSHDILAEILKRAAGENLAQKSVAGLILISREWCWKDFLALDHPEKEWALDELAKWVKAGDGAHEVLRRRAKKTEEDKEKEA